MGSWGIELFADDVACDVRDDYRELIEDGVDDDDATAQVLERYGETAADDDDGPVIWLAVAVSQWEIGRLVPQIRARALAVIDSGADLERWSDEPDLLAQRRAVLEEIRQQLTRPTRTAALSPPS